MVPKYTCIIVDDEPHAIELLKETLGILSKNIEVIECYTSWTSALEGLRSTECDLLFMDISIQEKNGMDLLKCLPEIRSEIIFITAHSNYALNAFKFSASGYILKPIDEVELAQAIDRSIKRIHDKKAKERHAAMVSSKIGIPGNKFITYVAVQDILYLEAINTCTRVVTKETEITSAYNLGKFRDLLPEHSFYQIHRSYIVNLNCIRRYETAGIVVMDNNKEIPVSKNLREQFQKLFIRVRPEDQKTK